MDSHSALEYPGFYGDGTAEYLVNLCLSNKGHLRYARHLLRVIGGH